MTEHVEIVEQRTVDSRVGDDRRQVRGWRLPADIGQIGEVAHEVEQYREQRPVLGKSGDVGIFRTEQLLGELQHPGEVRLGEPEDRQDHVQGEVQSHIRHEVALATLVGHVIHEPPCQQVDSALKCLQVLGLEPLVDDVAMRLVLVAVHLDEGLHRCVGDGIDLRGRSQRRDGGVGEDIGVSLDRHHVGVFRDGPELGIAIHRNSEDRRLVPNSLRGGVPTRGIGIGRGLCEDRAKLAYLDAGHLLSMPYSPQNRLHVSVTRWSQESAASGVLPELVVAEGVRDGFGYRR